MLSFLFLIHVILAVGLIVLRGLPTAERSRATRAAGMAGATAGLLLFFARGTGATWGTLSMDEGRAAVAGASVFCAWLLVAATDDGRGRWDVAALVGAGSTGLIGFALNDWIAPALLFWVCVSLAAAVGAGHLREGIWSSVSLGVSDVCAVGAVVAWAVQEESWRMPDRIDGWSLYLAAAGVALRAGALPRMGAWDLAGGGTVALIPLLIGSAFALVPTLSEGREIAVALPLLVSGLLAALWCAIRSPQVVLAAGWLVATMLALVFIAPGALGKAASAAVLTAGAVLLWSWAGGRAGPERGLLVAAVPLTVGFGPIVGGAVASFERASTAETVLDGAPWTAFAALLPAALAVGVTMGASIARRVEPESYRPAAVLATWAIAAVALVLGLTGGPDLTFDGGGELWLYLVAAAVAAGAARFAPKQPVRADVVFSDPALGVLQLPRPIARIAVPAGAVLIALGVAAAILFTYAGLRVGFL